MKNNTATITRRATQKEHSDEKVIAASLEHEERETDTIYYITANSFETEISILLRQRHLLLAFVFLNPPYYLI
jgi:hypothetical protein